MYSTVPTMAPSIVWFDSTAAWRRSSASLPVGSASPVSSTCRVRRGPRDAEVHDPRLVVRVDHDVGRLQIAVDHARFMRRAEP